MSKAKRRAHELKIAAARATAERRTAGARAAKTASTLATPASSPGEASARDGARFIVIERTEFDRRESEPDNPFMVVEAETLQIPENWFGRGWRGYHPTREAAEGEAGELNALTERFVPTGAATAPGASIGVPAPMLGERLTAWEQELLTSTAEMPAVPETGAAPESGEPRDGCLPGTRTLREAVTDVTALRAATESARGDAQTIVLPRIFDTKRGSRAGAWNPVPKVELFDGAADEVRREVGDEIEFLGISRMASVSHALDGAAATATAAQLLVDREHPILPNVVVKALLDTAFDVRPTLHEADPEEIKAGQLVLCADGSWQPVGDASVHNGLALLRMADGTEHEFSGAVRFWVRDPQPSAPIGVYRPPCPNACTVTADRLHECTCRFDCGCAPHPAGRPPRRSTLAGAVA